jgi:hypothetical protein
MSNLPLKDPTKFAQIGIFGSKTCIPSGNPALNTRDLQLKQMGSRVKAESYVHACGNPKNSKEMKMTLHIKVWQNFDESSAGLPDGIYVFSNQTAKFG